MNIFEQAARLAIRFDTPKGQVTAEDLFNLPLTSLSGRANLDDLAKDLHREIRSSAEETSFVHPASTGVDVETQLKFDIVKHVIGVRVAERDAAATEQKRKEEKQKILALIADKQDEALRGKSLEELQAMVQAL